MAIAALISAIGAGRDTEYPWVVTACTPNSSWKLLIDRNLMKKDLREMAGLSTNVIAKMGKNGDVSTEVLRKICKALDCGLDDIVEIVPNNAEN